MEHIEKWLLTSFFPLFTGIATLLGVIGIVFSIALLFRHLFQWREPFTFVGILVFGLTLFVVLKRRALNRRIKKLIDTEAMNIALAGNEPGNINKEACGIIARRIYGKLFTEGFVKDAKVIKSEAMLKKITDAVSVKYDHLKIRR